VVTVCTTSFSIQNSTFCPHTVFMCFVWISEQRAIISLYSINWLVFITETECVYCAVRTGYLNIIWVLCSIWISEQTAIISLYSINWFVFITETESVYCAVRTGSWAVSQVNVRLQSLKICFSVWLTVGSARRHLPPSPSPHYSHSSHPAHWLSLDVPPSITQKQQRFSESDRFFVDTFGYQDWLIWQVKRKKGTGCKQGDEGRKEGRKENVWLFVNPLYTLFQISMT